MPYELWECQYFVAATDSLNSIVAADVDDAVSLISPEKYFANYSWAGSYCRGYAKRNKLIEKGIRNEIMYYILCIMYCILCVIMMLSYMLLVF